MLNLLLIVAIVLVVLWVLGLVVNLMGGIIHILLVIALVFLIIWLWQRIKVKR